MKKKLLVLFLCFTFLIGLMPTINTSLLSDNSAYADTNNGNQVDKETLTENNGDYALIYEKLMACTTVEELRAIVDSMTEEEQKAFVESLSEEEYAALEEHITEIVPQEQSDPPETVNFTDAGPFMPAINVAVNSKIRRAAKATEQENGLILNKTAVPDGKGGYTITMESYTTGNVTTTTKAVPVDFVLVLDQSGSMSYNFEGKETDDDTQRRQAALKSAVNSFIDQVADKYSETADHRMALVTFGTNSSILQDWIKVDKDGKSELHGKIDGLTKNPYNEATNVDKGMSTAELLMGSNYKYSGSSTTRQKVVIVFTDGVPTSSTNFETDVANRAITSAKSLKDGGITVYSIGIFKGANPNQLHGNKWKYKLYDDIPCNGKVGSYWGGSYIASIFDNDFSNIDIAAGNRFLNYISCNFKTANEIGVTRGTFNPSGFTHLSDGTGYRIDTNFVRDDAKYYLTAGSAVNLNIAFETISNQITTPTITLGANAVVKDVVSQYFDMPQNTSDIKIYTAAYDGSKFGVREPSDLSPQINGDTISVTGFDYNANCVTDKPKHDGTYGKKLIIEFNITPKDGFLGGNNVPTNGDNSGVYENATDKTAIKEFDVPKVNVPIKDVTVTAKDKNVYLLGSLTTDQLKTDADVSIGKNKLYFSEDNYGLEPWQNEFVKIDFNTGSQTYENLIEDTTYTLNCTVTDNTDSSNTKSGSSEAQNIYVFKPELTYKDSTVYYGDNVPSDFSSNLTSTEWEHKTATGNIIGDEPTLTKVYTPDTSKVSKDIINSKSDIGVDVQVSIKGKDVTGDTTFKHTSCEGMTCTLPEEMEFLLHVETCSLKITKSGGAEDEPYVFTILKDGDLYTEASIVGNKSVTIYELPVGNYTIKEDAGWSWRYTANNGGIAELKSGNPEGEITCTNTKDKYKWLNGFSNVVRNIFSKGIVIKQ